MRPFLSRHSRSVVTGALPELDKITTETGSTYYSEKYVGDAVGRTAMYSILGGMAVGVGGTLLVQHFGKRS